MRHTHQSRSFHAHGRRAGFTEQSFRASGSRYRPFAFGLLLAIALLCITCENAHARRDSCEYDPATSGNSGTTSTPSVPNYADSVYIWADLHDYTHTCWSEYCHGIPKLRDYQNPNLNDTQACHNACENCCLYHFNVKNLRRNARIARIDLCTDRGCKPAPIPPLQPCIPPYFGVDHICEYCPAATMLFRGSLGQTPAFWNESPDCPKVLAPSNGTLADGYKDSLCRTNCLRIQTPSFGNAIAFLDTLQFTLGLTGDCHGRYRETGTGAAWHGKCIWICVTWSDGTQACHQIRVPHCTCTELPMPQCSGCTQDSCHDSVGPGSTSPPPKLSINKSKKGKNGSAGTVVGASKEATPAGTQLKRRR